MANGPGRPKRTPTSLRSDREKLLETKKVGGIPAFAEYSGISESYLYRVLDEGSRKGFSQKTLRKLEAFLDSRGILQQGQTSFKFERGKPINILPIESAIKMQVIEKKETVWVVQIELKKPIAR